jgi:hypothetical protein
VSGLFSFVPFLVPSVWLDAKKASLDAKVAIKAMKILRADLVVIIESLFYEYVRTENVLNVAKEILVTLNQSKVKPETLQETQQALQKTIDSSTWILEQNRYALSLALGFHNPLAIRSVRLPENTELNEEAELIDGRSLARDGFIRSIELAQLDLILQSQDTRRPWIYLNWLNPNGDSQTPLGFSLWAQSKELDGKRNEILIMQEEAKSKIFNRAYDISLSHNRALQLYVAAHRKSKVAQEGFLSLSRTVEGEAPSDQQSIQMITQAQNWIASSLEAQDQLRDLRIERAKVNRLVLSGHYADLIF